MNPTCFVCDSPATKVCKYKACSSPPFFCSGPCIKGVTEKMHTHDEGQDYISFEQYQHKLLNIKNKIDPSVCQKEYLQNIRKKVKLAKEHLQQQINSLDEVLKQLEKDLCETLCLKLTQTNSETIQRIDNGQQINGSKLNILFGNKLVFQDEKKILAARKQIQETFQKQLIKLSNWNLETLFLSFQQRVQKSEAFYQQGIILQANTNFQQARSKFQQARRFNNSNYLIHYQIAQCFYEEQMYAEAIQNYQLGLSLNQFDEQISNSIGHCYDHIGKDSEALIWYSKAIEIEQTAAYFSNRGDTFYKLQRYEQAVTDYLSAVKLQPDVKQYTERIIQIAELMNQNTEYSI